MVGKGFNLSPDGTAIQANNTLVSCPGKKAEIFLDRFMSVYPTNFYIKTNFEWTISRSKTFNPHNQLNDTITPEELKRSLPKSKAEHWDPTLSTTLCWDTYPQQTKATSYNYSTYCILQRQSLHNGKNPPLSHFLSRGTLLRTLPPTAP